MILDINPILKKSPFPKGERKDVFITLPEARKKRNYEKFKKDINKSKTGQQSQLRR